MSVNQGINNNQSFSEFILAVIDHEIRTIKPIQSEHGRQAWYLRESSESEYELLKVLMAKAGIQIPPAQDKYISISFKNTPFNDVVSALHYCRQELSLGFLGYDDLDSALPMPESEKFRALAKMTGWLAIDVSQYDSPLQHLGEWLEEVINPRWREIRDQLGRLNFRNFNPNTDYLGFISACLDTILQMLQEGLTNLSDFPAKCGYPIKDSSWYVLQKEFTDLRLNPTIWKYSSNGEEKIILEGPYSEFVKLYAEAKDGLISILSQRAKFKTQLERIFVVQVPTYGTFVPANSSSTDDKLKRWAFDRGIPTELTFPQSARVLFCLMAQERFEKEIEKVLSDRRLAHQMACNFQRSVLIHEHFHAILETGLDEKRSSANGVKFEEAWIEASPLNESLAAWMELHNARQNHDLMELVWSYIRAGSYPEWPYRGAEKIEALYQKKGIDAVGDLIRSIRRDPESTQAKFNAM